METHSAEGASQRTSHDNETAWSEDGNGFPEDEASPDSNEFTSLLQNLLGTTDTQPASSVRPPNPGEVFLPIPSGPSFAQQLWEEEERRQSLLDKKTLGLDDSNPGSQSASTSGSPQVKHSPGSVLPDTDTKPQLTSRLIGNDALGVKSTVFIPVTPMRGERRTRLSESPEASGSFSRLIDTTSGAAANAPGSQHAVSAPALERAASNVSASANALGSAAPKRELWADSVSDREDPTPQMEDRSAKWTPERANSAPSFERLPTWGRGSAPATSSLPPGAGRGHGTPAAGRPAEFPPLGGVQPGRGHPPEKDAVVVVDKRDFPELPRVAPRGTDGAGKKEGGVPAGPRAVVQLKKLTDLSTTLSPHKNAWACWNPVTGSKESQEDIEAAQREMAKELQATHQRLDAESWDDDERAGPRPGSLESDAEAQFVWEQQQGFGRGRGVAGRGNGPTFGRGVGRWPGYGRGGGEAEAGSLDKGYPQEGFGSPRGLGSGGGQPPQGVRPPRTFSSRSDAADTWRRKDPLPARDSPPANATSPDQGDALAPPESSGSAPPESNSEGPAISDESHQGEGTKASVPPAEQLEVGGVNGGGSANGQGVESVSWQAEGDGLAARNSSGVAVAEALGAVAPKEDVQLGHEAGNKDGVVREDLKSAGVSKESEAEMGASSDQSEAERVVSHAEGGSSPASDVGLAVGQTTGHSVVDTANQSVSLKTPSEALPAWILARMSAATMSGSSSHEEGALSDSGDMHQAEPMAPAEAQQTEHAWSETDPVRTPSLSAQSAGPLEPGPHKVEPLPSNSFRTEAFKTSAPSSEAPEAEAPRSDPLDIIPPPVVKTLPPQVANPFNQSNQGGFGGQTPMHFGAFSKQPEGVQPQNPKTFGSPPTNPEGLSRTSSSSSPRGFADLDAAIMAAKQSRFKKPGVSPTGFAHPPEKWVKKEPVTVWLPTSAAAPGVPLTPAWVPKAESGSASGGESGENLTPQEEVEAKPEESTSPVKNPAADPQALSTSTLEESEKTVEAGQYVSKANGDVSAEPAASTAPVAAPLSKAGSDVSRTSGDVSVEGTSRKLPPASTATPLGEPPKPSSEPSLSNRRDLLMQLITQRWRAPLGKQPLVRVEAKSDESGSEHEGAPIHTRRAGSHSPSEGSEKAVKTAGTKRGTERGPEVRPIEVVPFPGYTATELRERHKRLEQKRQEEAEHTRGVNGHQHESTGVLEGANGEPEEAKGEARSENGRPQEADGVNGDRVGAENEHPRSVDLFSGVASGASANGRNWTEEDIPTRAAAWEANLQRAGLVSGSAAPRANKHAAPGQSSAGDLAMSQRAVESLAAKTGVRFAWVPKKGGGGTPGKQPPVETSNSKETQRGEAGEGDTKSAVDSLAVGHGEGAEELAAPAGSPSRVGVQVAPVIDDAAVTASGAAKDSNGPGVSAASAVEADQPAVSETKVSEQPASTGRSDEDGQPEVIRKVHSDVASQSDQVETADGHRTLANGTGDVGQKSDGSGREQTVSDGLEESGTMSDGAGDIRARSDGPAASSGTQQPGEVGVSDATTVQAPSATEPVAQTTIQIVRPETAVESVLKPELQEAAPSEKAAQGRLSPSTEATAAGSNDVSAVESDVSRGQGQGDVSGGQSDVSSREGDASGGASTSTPKPKPKMLWSDDVEESEAAEMRSAAAGERPTSSGQGDVRASPVSANHSRGIGSLGNSLPIETTVMGTGPGTAEGERPAKLSQQKSGFGTGALQKLGSEAAAPRDANQNGLAPNPSVSKSEGDVWTFPEEALLPSESSETSAKVARIGANKALSSRGLVGESSAKMEGRGAAAKARTGPAAKKMALDPSDENFERIFLDASEKLAFKMGRPFDISVLNNELKKRVPGFDIKDSKFTRFLDLCKAMEDKGHVRLFRASNMTFAALPDDPAQYGWGPNGLYQLPLGTDRPKTERTSKPPSQNLQTFHSAGGKLAGHSEPPKAAPTRATSASTFKKPEGLAPVKSANPAYQKVEKEPTSASHTRRASSPGPVASGVRSEQAALPRSTSMQTGAQGPTATKPAAAAATKAKRDVRRKADVEAEALGAIMLILCENPSMKASGLGAKLIDHDRSLSEQVKIHFGGVTSFLKARPELFHLSDKTVNPGVALFTGQDSPARSTPAPTKPAPKAPSAKAATWIASKQAADGGAATAVIRTVSRPPVPEASAAAHSRAAQSSSGDAGSYGASQSYGGSRNGADVASRGEDVSTGYGRPGAGILSPKPGGPVNPGGSFHSSEGQSYGSADRASTSGRGPVPQTAYGSTGSHREGNWRSSANRAPGGESAGFSAPPERGPSGWDQSTESRGVHSAASSYPPGRGASDWGQSADSRGGDSGASSTPPGTGGPAKKAEWHLFVTHLPPDCPYAELKVVLSQFGEVHGLSLPRGRLFGFVRFTNPDSARQALAQGYAELGRKRILLKKYSS
ncbi:hypothetical protein KFL_000690380 [Klebsormidium nitens]|uniref:RRM domain-containing protein n=1 Tax=Klebsormidium nitens TaxID=105231 RepID=A0A1Y1HR12_KLENI|nr:hypothetical protein KFL_000690380 [Klebsormidium nitens]|eukprot:GAQ81060.1 hypothetical protein KFL_000690380 [Klebsormidium nitens]